MSCYIAKGLPYEGCCLFKSVQVINGKLNITAPPMPDLGDISGKGNRRIEVQWRKLHPNAKATLLQMGGAEYPFTKGPIYVLGLV